MDGITGKNRQIKAWIFPRLDGIDRFGLAVQTPQLDLFPLGKIREVACRLDCLEHRNGADVSLPPGFLTSPPT